jgi:hypothetical protein
MLLLITFLYFTIYKNYVRYAVRQKRTDAKSALKSLLFNGKTVQVKYIIIILYCLMSCQLRY